MTERLWVLVTDTDWGDRRTLDEETMEMVDTIHVGSQIEFELEVGLFTAMMLPIGKYRHGEPVPDAEPLFENTGEGLPLCHFVGRVLDVYCSGIPEPDRRAGPIRRGIANFWASLDCGLPVCLFGPSGRGDTKEDIVGDWVEGSGIAYANLIQPHCPLEKTVKGKVKEIVVHPPQGVFRLSQRTTIVAFEPNPL
jgi:hypothetical protein